MINISKNIHLKLDQGINKLAMYIKYEYKIKKNLSYAQLLSFGKKNHFNKLCDFFSFNSLNYWQFKILWTLFINNISYIMFNFNYIE